MAEGTVAVDNDVLVKAVAVLRTGKTVVSEVRVGVGAGAGIGAGMGAQRNFFERISITCSELLNEQVDHRSVQDILSLYSCCKYYLN